MVLWSRFGSVTMAQGSASETWPVMEQTLRLARDGGGEGEGVVGRLAQQVERDALGRALPDAGQPAELFEQSLVGGGVGHDG